MKCCICKRKIEACETWERGNNASPIKEGRCCDVCNETKVIPARLNKDYKEVQLFIEQKAEA